MKRIFNTVIAVLLVLSLFIGCSQSDEFKMTATAYTDEEIYSMIDKHIENMTLEEKAAQMVQASLSSVISFQIEEYGIGSVLSGGGAFPGSGSTEEWNNLIEKFQAAAGNSSSGIPLIYGVDAVHGHDHLLNSVIYPHNINLGAANDEKLVEELGKQVAIDMKATSIYWNFAPCTACAYDPRWGRTYESFSTDVEITTNLSHAFAKGLQENGVAGTAKHYIGDGGTLYGTGEKSAIDRGDTVMSEEELREKFLPPYEVLVDAGILTVMPSYSMYNGVRMHEHAYLINDVLKGELEFKGFVISDWEGHHSIDAKSYQEKIEIAVNSGIDMFMEPNLWRDCIDALIKGVKKGTIAIERINDAVIRILYAKYKIGLFDETDKNIQDRNVDKQIELAIELVEKSCVLIKNDNDLLPLEKGTKVLVVGPAMDDIGVQCGGWTVTWQGAKDGEEKLTEGTTLLEALNQLAQSKKIEIITDRDRVDEADIILLAVGEIPYAEFSGDSSDISLTGKCGLPENEEAIVFAAQSGKPTITVVFAGRNVMISEYMNSWSSIVMAYLPGSQAEGIANLVYGDAKFTGKLPMPWYSSVDEIGKENPELLFDIGYGLE